MFCCLLGDLEVRISPDDHLHGMLSPAAAAGPGRSEPSWRVFAPVCHLAGRCSSLSQYMKDPHRHTLIVKKITARRQGLRANVKHSRLDDALQRATSCGQTMVGSMCLAQGYHDTLTA